MAYDDYYVYDSDIELEYNYCSTADVQQFQNEINKHLDSVRGSKNRRMRKHARFLQVRKHMERVFTRKSILFCVDVEAWELDQRYVTEIGVSIYDPRKQELALIPNIKTYHIMMDENRTLHNGIYVPDHSDNFSGGTTQVLTHSEALDLLNSLVCHYFAAAPFDCSLVGHDLRGDLKWLEKLGVDIPNNVRKLDTQTLFSYTHGIEGASLKNALSTVNQPYAFLHNAGNDAYYTILLALKLCDPSVRQLTGIDYLKTGEKYGEPVFYKKTETNESTLAYPTVLALDKEITKF